MILPLAMPGVAAGSIFTFSLTLGDYIIPQVIGDSTLYIGQVVYRQQGVAGNMPFAAAFSLVPIVVDRRLPVAGEAQGSLRCALTPPRRAVALQARRLGRRRFLHVPLALIVLYAFSAEDKSYVFPPPALTTQWFARRLGARRRLGRDRAVVRRSRAWSHGDRARARHAGRRRRWRARTFFGRDAISLLLILPIALPGVVTGIALRSAYHTLEIPFTSGPS